MNYLELIPHDIVRLIADKLGITYVILSLIPLCPRLLTDNNYWKHRPTILDFFNKRIKRLTPSQKINNFKDYFDFLLLNNVYPPGAEHLIDCRICLTKSIKGLASFLNIKYFIDRCLEQYETEYVLTTVMYNQRYLSQECLLYVRDLSANY